MRLYLERNFIIKKTFFIVYKYIRLNLHSSLRDRLFLNSDSNKKSLLKTSSYILFKLHQFHNSDKFWSLYQSYFHNYNILI